MHLVTRLMLLDTLVLCASRHRCRWRQMRLLARLPALLRHAKQQHSLPWHVPRIGSRRQILTWHLLRSWLQWCKERQLHVAGKLAIMREDPSA